MTREQYIWCVSMFIMGQLLHLFLSKIPALMKRAKVANYQFKISDYWKEEWYIVIGTQIFGAMTIIGIDEIAHWKPDVVDYVKWFFAGLGYFFSSVIIKWLGTYEKKLLKIINIKTDISDGVSETDIKGKPVSMQTAAPGESSTGK